MQKRRTSSDLIMNLCLFALIHWNETICCKHFLLLTVQCKLNASFPFLYIFASFWCPFFVNCWNSLESGYKPSFLFSHVNLIHPVQSHCINPKGHEVVVVTKDQQTRWWLLPFYSQIWRNSGVLYGAWPVAKNDDVPPIVDQYNHVLIYVIMNRM